MQHLGSYTSREAGLNNISHVVLSQPNEFAFLNLKNINYYKYQHINRQDQLLADSWAKFSYRQSFQGKSTKLDGILGYLIKSHGSLWKFLKALESSFNLTEYFLVAQQLYKSVRMFFFFFLFSFGVHKSHKQTQKLNHTIANLSTQNQT